MIAEATADRSLAEFCAERLPAAFNRPPTERQLRALETLEVAIREPRTTSRIFPRRGEGATTQIAAAALFAIVQRLRRYVLIVQHAGSFAESTICFVGRELGPWEGEAPRRSERLRAWNGDNLIEARSVHASLRGLIHYAADGEAIRPDLVLVDDLAMRLESPALAAATAARLEVLRHDVLGRGGSYVQVIQGC